MYKLLSRKIVALFIESKYVSKEKKEIFEYCFEALLSTTINIIIIISISTLIRLFAPSLLFLLSFILSRMCFGGYHAKSHLGCLLSMIINYLLFSVALNILIYIDSLYTVLFFNILSIILVHILAPVENKYNPLSAVHRKKLKRFSYIVSYGIFTISLVLYFLDIIPNWVVYSLLIGLLSAAFAMLLGKLEIFFKKGGRKIEKKTNSSANIIHPGGTCIR